MAEEEEGFLAQLAGCREMVAAGRPVQALEMVHRLRRQLTVGMKTKYLWQTDEICGAAYYALGDMEKTTAAYWQAVQHDTLRRCQLQHYSNYLFCLHYLQGINEADMKEQHCHYNDFLRGIQTFQHPRKKKAKLRLGYMSPDLRQHTNAGFIWPLLQHRDKERFEVYLYSFAEQEDAFSDKLRDSADGWQRLRGLASAEAAALIRSDSIDILFDMSGHAAGGATLLPAAYRPAPVQICGLGWFDTTGMAAFDYFLADAFTGGQDFFREKLLVLPGSHLCYTPSRQMQDFAEKSWSRRGVSEKIIFGCFNNFAKITDRMLCIWQKIMERCHNAKLFLHDTSAQPVRLETMRCRLDKAGFPLSRIELRSGETDYLPYLDMVDIVLDTYPYTGGAMTCEALYLGIPVISLFGRRHNTRFGYGLLSQVGLSDLASDTEKGYIDRALFLAKDRERRRLLRAELPGRMISSALMDGAAYTAHCEEAYEYMWRRWLNGQAG